MHRLTIKVSPTTTQLVQVREAAVRVERLSELASTIRRLAEASARMPRLGNHIERSHTGLLKQIEMLDAIVAAEEDQVTVELLTAEAYAMQRRSA
jgi:hypothetical protein